MTTIEALVATIIIPILAIIVRLAIHRWSGKYVRSVSITLKEGYILQGQQQTKVLAVTVSNEGSSSIFPTGLFLRHHRWTDLMPRSKIEYFTFNSGDLLINPPKYSQLQPGQSDTCVIDYSGFSAALAQYPRRRKRFKLSAIYILSKQEKCKLWHNQV